MSKSEIVNNMLSAWNLWTSNASTVASDQLNDHTIEVGRFIAAFIQHIFDEYGTEYDLLMEIIPTSNGDVRVLASGEWKICDPEDLPFFHIIGRYFPSISSLTDLDEFKNYIHTYLGTGVTNTWNWVDQIPQSKLIKYAKSSQPGIKQYFFEDHNSVFSRPL
jgi:hypothetical protein